MEKEKDKRDKTPRKGREVQTERDGGGETEGDGERSLRRTQGRSAQGDCRDTTEETEVEWGKR